MVRWLVTITCRNHYSITKSAINRTKRMRAAGAGPVLLVVPMRTSIIESCLKSFLKAGRIALRIRRDDEIRRDDDIRISLGLMTGLGGIRTSLMRDRRAVNR